MTTTVAIICDHDPAPCGRVVAGHESVGAARRQAKADGWQVAVWIETPTGRQLADYCAAHHHRDHTT